MVVGVLTYNTMSDATHVRAFRLFDLAHSHNSGTHFELTLREKQHLEICEECRALTEFFSHQVTERPLLHNNGDLNTADGWYKNICCGMELFVPAGKLFPDCRRHKNLPTSWKRNDDRNARAANRRSA